MTASGAVPSIRSSSFDESPVVRGGLGSSPAVEVVGLEGEGRGERNVASGVPLEELMLVGCRVVEVEVGGLVEVDVVRTGRLTVVEGRVTSGIVGRGRDVGTVSEVVGAVGTGKAAAGSTAKSP